VSCGKRFLTGQTPSDRLLDEVLGGKGSELDPSLYEYPGDREGVERLKALQIDKIVKLYIRYWSGPQGMAALLGNAIEITRKQFGDIYQTGVRAASNLSMPVPRMFVLQNPIMNAATYGVDEQNFVMLTSALVDALSGDELAFTLGHEFGHIKSNHVLYLNAAHWAISGAVALLGMIVAGPIGLIVGPAFRVALNEWSRKAEYTADRAGLIACRDLNSSILSLVKITLGSRSLIDKVDLEAFLEQMEERAAQEYGFVEMFQSHPFMPKRVKEIKDFYATGFRFVAGLE
jgi:Zn-dependent protease with chaperone function